MKPETCENCGRAIGKLETPAIWGDCIVCPECYTRLDANAARKANPVSAPQRQNAHTLTPTEAQSNDVGPIRKTAGVLLLAAVVSALIGATPLACLLFLAGLVVGIVSLCRGGA